MTEVKYKFGSDSDESGSVNDESGSVTDESGSDIEFGGNTTSEVSKSFEIIDSDGAIRELSTIVNDVHELTGFPKEVCAVILDHFQWNKELLFESYERSVHEEFLTECKVLQAVDRNEIVGDCNICYGDEAKLLSLSCGHSYCRDCWQRHLKSKINDEKIWTIPCMEPKCGGILTEEIVRQLSDNSTFNNYKKLAAGSFIQVSDLVKWCPGVNCGRIARIVDLECPGVKCTCNESFCVGCDNENHNPINCTRLEKWIKKCREDNESEDWISKNSKKCPRCKAPIQKNGGCNHMTCRTPGCRYEFCWLCMGPWARGHACNRPDVDPKDTQTGADLKVYLHYFGRFMNHKNSLKLEQQLKDHVEEKREYMKDIYECTNGDVKFLDTSILTLAECRRALMYTYAFAFFINPNHQKAIFEINQEKLEAAVEELSHLLENEFNFDPEALKSWKRNVIDKSKQVENLKTALIDHVVEGNNRTYWDYKS
jgi:ariadne-1